MSLLKIASVPAATVSPQSAVTEAVQLMNDKRVGAVAVIDNDALEGIFTERDVIDQRRPDRTRHFHRRIPLPPGVDHAYRPMSLVVDKAADFHAVMMLTDVIDLRAGVR